MSTGKRLAKRSILGTRVCAPQHDGLYRPGVIQATKTDAADRENIYCVLFEDKTTCEYSGQNLIGPGFQNVNGSALREGQKVYVTFNGREVSGTVVSRFPDSEEVVILITPSQQNHHIAQPVELRKRVEEVRLMESRKSARLQDLDTDYSRLAEGQTELRRRASSLSIDVPASLNGRKRRPSATEDVDTMDDCMAAMVLMSLSCSPKSPRLPDSGVYSHSWTSSSSGASSWTSNRSPPRTTTPSPPSVLSGKQGSASPTQDEGIELDETLAFLDEPTPAKKKRVVFQCTWPGCGSQFSECDDVERHVRISHLGREDTSDDSEASDREEEFYYTEIEVDEADAPLTPPPSDQDSSLSILPSIYTSSAPTLSHLDMVRPPHEDPEYKRQIQVIQPFSAGLESAAPINIPVLQRSTSWQPHQPTYAASAPTTTVSPQKFMRLTPKTLSSSPKGSPLHRRGRSESRKCRKVYGMENRDLWCTQCKWKKACSRFTD